MKSSSDTKNWYQDKYLVANVQKNILLILAVVLSIGIFISLILVKYVYENRSVEPYLLDIDKKTGQATIVESESVRQFTASEVVKESFVVNYVKTREGYKKETDSENKNLLRVLSAKDTYSYYTDNVKKQAQSDLLDNEKNALIDVYIKSIIFTSPKTAELKITRRIIMDSNVVRKKYFRIRIVFDFFDIDLPLEDRYLNPFGFQVISYDSIEEKVVDGYDPDKEDTNKQAQINNATQL